jgi:hypothetical protein
LERLRKTTKKNINSIGSEIRTWSPQYKGEGINSQKRVGEGGKKKNVYTTSTKVQILFQFNALNSVQTDRLPSAHKAHSRVCFDSDKTQSLFYYGAVTVFVMDTQGVYCQVEI